MRNYNKKSCIFATAFESPDGGIGRRVRFRCVYRKMCRFDSCSGHKKNLEINDFQGFFLFHRQNIGKKINAY